MHASHSLHPQEIPRYRALEACFLWKEGPHNQPPYVLHYFPINKSIQMFIHIHKRLAIWTNIYNNFLSSQMVYTHGFLTSGHFHTPFFSRISWATEATPLTTQCRRHRHSRSRHRRNRCCFWHRGLLDPPGASWLVAFAAKWGFLYRNCSFFHFVLYTVFSFIHLDQKKSIEVFQNTHQFHIGTFHVR